MNIQQLIKDICKTGPENVKKFMEVVEKLPTDETLGGLNVTLNNLIPYLPQLEKILGDGNLKNVERIVKRIPDTKSIDRLVDALPMLERLPDKQTLTKLLDKADSLQAFVDSLDK